MSHAVQIVEHGQEANGIAGAPQISMENKDLSNLKRLHSNSQTTDPPTDGESYMKRAREITVADPLADISTELASDAIPAPPCEASNQPKKMCDPWCDQKYPREIRFETVSAAHLKIRGGIERTPCPRSLQLSTLTKMDLYLKKEFLHITGSFKERGARYTLLCLSKDQKDKGVIAASAGNHALALCYHGQQLGIPVTVVMPVIAPIMKISRCRTFGATVIVNGADIGESKEYAMRIADEQGLMYVNGYDHPHILAGQGTMMLEIIDQVTDLDAVIIPVGGAGLIAGCAVAVKTLCPNVKVIGVEAANCPSFTNALAAGKPVYTKPKSSLADGLAVPLVGFNAFKTAQKLVDKVVLVREEFIALSILRLVEMEKAVVEGAGATVEIRT